jgi:hypothetical protein
MAVGRIGYERARARDGLGFLDSVKRAREPVVESSSLVMTFATAPITSLPSAFAYRRCGPQLFRVTDCHGSEMIRREK